MGRGALRFLNVCASSAAAIRAHLSAPKDPVKRFVFLLALALPGCTVDGLDEIFCDPDEPCWTATTPSSEVCPVGPLGYNPARTDAEPVAFSSDVSALAARLEPFETATTCTEIVVGFSTVDGCVVPSKGITLFAFGSTARIPAEIPTDATFDHLAPVGDIAHPMSGITEVRFPIPTSYKPGFYPIVGIVTHSGTCPASFESACSSNALTMNYKGQWREDDGVNYYFGLGGCSP